VQRIDGVGLFVEQRRVDIDGVVVRHRHVAHAVFVIAFQFGSEENLSMCKVVITITMTSCKEARLAEVTICFSLYTLLQWRPNLEIEFVIVLLFDLVHLHSDPSLPRK